MGKAWDNAIPFDPETRRTISTVLKPGGYFFIRRVENPSSDMDSHRRRWPNNPRHDYVALCQWIPKKQNASKTGFRADLCCIQAGWQTVIAD
jgi:hypothetical protein